MLINDTVFLHMFFSCVTEHLQNNKISTFSIKLFEIKTTISVLDKKFTKLRSLHYLTCDRHSMESISIRHNFNTKFLKYWTIFVLYVFCVIFIWIRYLLFIILIVDLGYACLWEVLCHQLTVALLQDYQKPFFQTQLRVRHLRSLLNNIMHLVIIVFTVPIKRI